jgi:hypothetical protein
LECNKGSTRCLKGTIDYGIKYTDASDVELTGYSDSDWADNLDDRRSTTGYAFSIEFGVVSWSSKKHPTISLSSTEEEYKALCAATCEVVWLRRLLQDVGEKRKEPMMIRCDKNNAPGRSPVFKNPMICIWEKAPCLLQWNSSLLRESHNASFDFLRRFPSNHRSHIMPTVRRVFVIDS